MRPLVLGIVVLLAGSCGRAEVFQLAPPAQAGSGGGPGAPGAPGVSGGGAGGSAGGAPGTGGGGGGTPEVALALTEEGGCGDAFLFASNPEDTAMVTVYWPDLIAAVKQEAGSYGDFKITAPFTGSSRPEVFFSRGRYVRDFACGDIVRPDSHRVQGELKSGSVRVEITFSTDPTKELRGPWGTLTLENALFVDPAGGELRLEKLRVGPVLIGWLPG